MTARWPRLASRHEQAGQTAPSRGQLYAQPGKRLRRSAALAPARPQAQSGGVCCRVGDGPHLHLADRAGLTAPLARIGLRVRSTLRDDSFRTYSASGEGDGKKWLKPAAHPLSN